MPLLPFVGTQSCHDASSALLNVLKEALDAQDAVADRAAELKSMSARDLLVYLRMPEQHAPDGLLEGASAAKRRKAAVTTLSALDIWAKGGESVQMVAALSWWCEAIAMWEAVRTLLALDDERQKIAWGSAVDEHLLERWYRSYCNISGVKQCPSKKLFAIVVKSVITGQQGMRVVWSGRSGEESCALAECERGCDGRHIGLRVRWDGKGNACIQIRDQIGVSFNPKELKHWTALPGTPKHKDPTVRIKLIQSFLKSSDNVFRVSRTQHVFMIGLWGLVEHCCDSPSLEFSKDNVLESGGAMQAGCKFQLLSGTSICTSRNGFCVWSYGKKFMEQMDCKCFSCK